MNINNLLNHLVVIKETSIGKTTFRLVVNRADPNGNNRFVLIDLSHQIRTQANYLSSLTSVMQEWQCWKVILYLNTATPGLTSNIPAQHWQLVSANHSPLRIGQYELFPLLWQTDSSNLECWVPQLRKNYTEQQVWDIINNN